VVASGASKRAAGSGGYHGRSSRRPFIVIVGSASTSTTATASVTRPRKFLAVSTCSEVLLKLKPVDLVPSRLVPRLPRPFPRSEEPLNDILPNLYRGFGRGKRCTRLETR
jgi:hypothetical protein